MSFLLKNGTDNVVGRIYECMSLEGLLFNKGIKCITGPCAIGKTQLVAHTVKLRHDNIVKAYDDPIIYHSFDVMPRIEDAIENILRQCKLWYNGMSDPLKSFCRYF